MENIEALEVLSSAIQANKLPAKDVGFASDLVSKSARGLSEKQWYWVRVFAERVSGGQKPAVLAEFSGVYALLSRAREHLKNPKIRLRTEAGRDITVYVSSQRSCMPDTVNVTGDNGTWYGRVLQSGEWQYRHSNPEPERKAVEAILYKLAADPEKVAAEYGKLTGNCCFCGRGLSDERSTEVGYGKVCSQRFGLPWG